MQWFEVLYWNLYSLPVHVVEQVEKVREWIPIVDYMYQIGVMYLNAFSSKFFFAQFRS